ncbi:glutathione-dependent formaldehyde-activating protein [Alcanivorax hongdengensis A-11-3]|uniref:Glutathione-dependent formaldehyde-activating protein n=1 Tax=Alcanivorax hongdengensis A-11-3 TaxID=1177179 RepID=L0WCV6_9GAMM|nr:GFA family protein [Alcanivorax hongdengensis]EKF74786.1 glutathione-dependent formaldehyde-activating protein [Alcanivorax hongdengensis A-11-3]
MSETAYPVYGACQCGQVRYRLLAAPRMVVACHCRECQKLSTSAFSITAVVAADDLIFEGTLRHWERTADSGNINAAAFCPDCGNRIYHYDPAQPDIIKLKPSNLDDTRLIQPQAHVWVSEKQAWFEIPEGVPQFDRQP